MLSIAWLQLQCRTRLDSHQLDCSLCRFTIGSARCVPNSLCFLGDSQNRSSISLKSSDILHQGGGTEAPDFRLDNIRENFTMGGRMKGRSSPNSEKITEQIRYFEGYIKSLKCIIDPKYTSSNFLNRSLPIKTSLFKFILIPSISFKTRKWSF